MPDHQSSPDMARIAAEIGGWMRDHSGVPGECENLRLLSAGTQNRMMMFTFASGSYVVRQPPPGAIFPPKRQVEREARVLAALAGTDVPHPTLVGWHLADEPLGGPFYVMAAVDGFNATEQLSDDIASSAARQAEMGLSCVDALVKLSRLNPAAVGLGDLGKPDGFLGRQVTRWRSQLDSYSRFEGWEAQGSLLHAGVIGDWLDRNRPSDETTGLIHGDLHLGNIMFAPSGRTVAALIDWELATIGDPLVDLGWLLATWPDRNGADTGSGIAVPGASALPAPHDLFRRYCELSSRPVASIGWYMVLASYKLGIIQEGSWARALTGQADRTIGALQHARAQAMMARAAMLIERIEDNGCPWE